MNDDYLSDLTLDLLGGLEALKGKLRRSEALCDRINADAALSDAVKASASVIGALNSLSGIEDPEEPLLKNLLPAAKRLARVQAQVDAIPHLQQAVRVLEQLKAEAEKSPEIQATREARKKRQLQGWNEIK